MFRKLNPALWEWQYVATIGTFFFTLAVFCFFILRAIRMKRSDVEHMSRLAVDDDGEGSRHGEPRPPNTTNLKQNSNQ